MKSRKMDDKIQVWIDPELRGMTEIKSEEVTPEEFFQMMHDILGDD